MTRNYEITTRYNYTHMANIYADEYRRDAIGEN